jgi:hypothetical protein
MNAMALTADHEFCGHGPGGTEYDFVLVAILVILLIVMVNP